MSWGQSTEEKKELSIKDFEQLCAGIKSQREVCEAAKQAKKIEDDKLDELEGKAVEMLMQAGKKSYDSEVGTVGISYRTSFVTPKLPEDRAAFFGWLKDKGMYDSLITVNSQTLNSVCRTELEKARERGETEFKIPGIQDPTTNTVLSFRKK